MKPVKVCQPEWRQSREFKRRHKPQSAISGGRVCGTLRCWFDRYAS